MNNLNAHNPSRIRLLRTTAQTATWNSTSIHSRKTWMFLPKAKRQLNENSDLKEESCESNEGKQHCNTDGSKETWALNILNGWSPKQQSSKWHLWTLSKQGELSRHQWKSTFQRNRTLDNANRPTPKNLWSTNKALRYRPHNNEKSYKSRLESIKEMNTSQNVDAVAFLKFTKYCDDDYKWQTPHNRKMQHIIQFSKQLNTTVAIQPQCKTSEGRTIYIQLSGLGGAPNTQLKYNKRILWDDTKLRTWRYKRANVISSGAAYTTARSSHKQKSQNSASLLDQSQG